MLPYISTRAAAEATLPEALSRGLAPDGGLYVPRSVPGLAEASAPAAGEPFVRAARWAARTMVSTAAPEVLDQAAEAALDFPVPLVEVEPGVFVLELFHGPTAAFKDVGARFMAHLMALTLPSPVASGPPAVGTATAGENGDTERTVLVATSGDTGGAVAHAFHRLPGYRVAVLFPRHGISDRQRRQMTTLGANVVAIAVEGTFDDCQRLAKEAFRDEALRDGHRLTSANSINVGRLLPQSFYYVHAALQLGWHERPAWFVVPSGNLGNLCAGLIATRAGMPARGFVAATNANDGFVRFLEAGRHAPRPSIATASNAMDVGDPSNLERIVWLYGDDIAAIRRDVRGVSVSDEETVHRIREVHGRTGYVLDPHTAVAYHAAVEAGLARGGGDDPVVVLATAHPAKFPEVVEPALGTTVPLPDTLAAAMRAPEIMTSIAPTLDALAAALTTSVATDGAPTEER